MTSDPFDLERFVTAQDAHGTYARALAELRSARRQSASHPFPTSLADGWAHHVVVVPASPRLVTGKRSVRWRTSGQPAGTSSPRIVGISSETVGWIPTDRWSVV